MPFSFDNSFASLPTRFYSPQKPTPVSAPVTVKINKTLAFELGIDVDALETPEGAELLAGNRVPNGASPIAMAYAGHQFGGWVPQLGDGRAVLLGEVIGKDGIRRDIQLKGAGRTIFSRNGDGRATLGSVLREYLVSEAMNALGVPTTRSLAAVTTGEQIVRDGYEPGAILTRVAQSHIRVGTFQFHFSKRDEEALRLLAEHVIARHYQEVEAAPNPILAMLEQVIARQADLVARWMQIGFIHGVMNTDNSSISGETIDYGPCAFMDEFHPAKVFSSIDRQGRYAWNNQPNIAQWNMAQFAQTLIPLLSDDEAVARELAQSAVEQFSPLFSNAFYEKFASKVGLLGDSETARELINEMITVMTDGSVDFTLFFRNLTVGTETEDYSAVKEMFFGSKSFDNWLSKRQKFLGKNIDSSIKEMRTSNPIFIPRNHRIEEVVIAANNGDLGPFERLHSVLSRPYDPQPENSEYEGAPKPDEIVQATFCGT